MFVSLIPDTISSTQREIVKCVWGTNRLREAEDIRLIFTISNDIYKILGKSFLLYKHRAFDAKDYMPLIKYYSKHDSKSNQRKIELLTESLKPVNFEKFGNRANFHDVQQPKRQREHGKIFHDKALTMALLDRITHNAIILNMNGESYRRKQNKKSKS